MNYKIINSNVHINSLRTFETINHILKILKIQKRK
jgi:hypothetical protein